MGVSVARSERGSSAGPTGVEVQVSGISRKQPGAGLHTEFRVKTNFCFNTSELLVGLLFEAAGTLACQLGAPLLW